MLMTLRHELGFAQTKDVGDVEERENRVKELGRRIKDGTDARRELRELLPGWRAEDPDNWGPKRVEKLLEDAVDRVTISRWTSKAASKPKGTEAA